MKPYALALVCLSAGGLWAQSYQGGVRGVIHEPAGSAIADAKIT